MKATLGRLDGRSWARALHPENVLVRSRQKFYESAYQSNVADESIFTTENTISMSIGNYRVAVS